MTPQEPVLRRELAAIGRNELLARLASADFALLGPHLTETVLDRGALLQEPGQKISRVYFPHSGLVSLTVVLPEGRPFDAVNIGREGVIGHAAGLGPTIAVSGAVVQLQMRAACIAAGALAAAAEHSATLRAAIVHYNQFLIAALQQAA